jgi:hypothetical protein
VEFELAQRPLKSEVDSVKLILAFRTEESGEGLSEVASAVALLSIGVILALVALSSRVYFLLLLGFGLGYATAKMRVFSTTARFFWSSEPSTSVK